MESHEFMKRRQQFAVLLLSISFPLSGHATESTPLKVLFIGNSYTGVNDLPAMVASLSEAGRSRKIEADRHLVGGCTLERHVKETGALQKIREQAWEVVVLQEQSLRPVVDRDRMFEFARTLDAEIGRRGAQTVFYLTWARQHIPDMQEGANPIESPEYTKMMFEISGAAKSMDCATWCEQHEAGLQGGLDEAYLAVAEQLGAKVSPVGVAWKKALAADPPFVLHRPDKSHPNPTGTYLAACVFYATLLDKCPVGLPGKIEMNGKLLVDLSEEQSRRLQEIAWESIQEIDRRKPSLRTTYTNPVGEKTHVLRRLRTRAKPRSIPAKSAISSFHLGRSRTRDDRTTATGRFHPCLVRVR